VTLTADVAGALRGLSSENAGASNENAVFVEPATALTVSATNEGYCMYRLSTDKALTEVCEVHEVEMAVANSSVIVGVEDVPPNDRPETVSHAPPDDGAFTGLELLSTAASNVRKLMGPVPVSDFTIIRAVCSLPPPPCKMHLAVVKELQLALAQTSAPINIEGVVSNTCRFAAPTHNVLLSDAAMLPL
jgi:hypothetical protein